MSQQAALSNDVYHGWKVVGALFVVGMMVYGCGLYSFTLFIEPLTQEFGWSRAATSGLVSVYWLAAPLALAGGPAIRRIGGFRLIAGGVIVAAVATLLLGFCNSLPLLFLLRFAMGVGKVMMASGVTLLTAHWFTKRFGMALACCYAGWHFGGLAMVPMTQWLIDTVGWRETTGVLALLIAVISLPPLIAWTRTPSPVERGEEPETGLPLRVESAETDRPQDTGLDHLLRQPVLWLSILITVLGGIAYGALLTHEATLVGEIHSLKHLSAMAVSLTAFSALCGALLLGWLADRLPFLSIVSIEFLLLSIGSTSFFLLYSSPSTGLLWGGALCFGLAVGGFEAAVLPNMRRAFSTAVFDRVFGIWYLCYLATLFAAPIAAGWIHDITDSYRLVTGVLIVTSLLAFLPALALSRQAPSPEQKGP